MSEVWQEINWGKVQAAAENAQLTRPSSGQDTSNYLKMPEGLNELRLLPTGNYLEGLPWIYIVRHEFEIMTPASGKQLVNIMCWNFISEFRTTVGQTLGKLQKLVENDVSKFKKHGCPGCKTAIAMQEKNVPKNTVSTLWPKKKYQWNALTRRLAEGGTIDQTVYVWTSSFTTGEAVIAAIGKLQKGGVNPLDLRNGFDFHITATGSGKGRRYKNGMFFPIPAPLFDPRSGLTQDSIIPNNLTEVACNDFKTYQETIDLINEGFGNILTHIGYEMPGDENNWASATPQLTQVERQEIFPGSAPTIQPQQWAPVTNSFDDMVPPSVPDVNLPLDPPKKKNGQSGKVLAMKKPNANAPEGDVWGFDDDEPPF